MKKIFFVLFFVNLICAVSFAYEFTPWDGQGTRPAPAKAISPEEWGDRQPPGGYTAPPLYKYFDNKEAALAWKADFPVYNPGIVWEEPLVHPASGTACFQIRCEALWSFTAAEYQTFVASAPDSSWYPPMPEMF